MSVLRHIVLVGIVVCEILALFWLSVMLIYGRNRNLDTQFADYSIFQAESTMAVYGSPIVARLSKHPEVVLLGASNTRFAWRPGEVSAQAGNIPVHNLGMGGRPAHNFLRTVEFIYSQTPAEQRKNIIFVLGSWFGMFIPNTIIAGSPNENAMDDEAARYGLYRVENQSRIFFLPGLEGYSPLFFEACYWRMLPSAYHDMLWRALQDWQVIDSLPKSISGHLAHPDDVLNAVPPHEDVWTREATVHTEWGTPDSWDDSEYQDLSEMARIIHREGGQFIFADLPVTPTVQRIYANERYERKLHALLPALVRDQSLIYLDMNPKFNREEFFDWVHIKPSSTPKAASVIAEAIRIAMKRLNTP